MTPHEKALLAKLRRLGEVQTTDETSIRGLELRGLVARLGEGRVRLVEQKIEKAPREKIEALKAALREGAKTRQEALAIVGDPRLLWLAVQENDVVRLASGDYVIEGGPLRAWSRRPQADLVRKVMPPGVAMRAAEIARQAGIADRSMRNLLTQMVESGELTRVSSGVYVR